MKNARINIYNWTTHILDSEIKQVIGEESYQQCLETRGYKKFITKKSNGLITYHFTKSACEKLYDYIFQHRDTHLYDIYVGCDGYKISFKI